MFYKGILENTTKPNKLKRRKSDYNLETHNFRTFSFKIYYKN